MSKNAEYPFDPQRYAHKAHTQNTGPMTAVRPLTEIELLMRLPPHATSEVVPVARTAALKELLGRTIDDLDPEDRYIIEELLIAGRSLRKTGAVLGIPKTTLARRRDRIRRHLMTLLIDEPLLRDWLTR